MRTCVWCGEALEAGERCWRFANGATAHRVCALRQVIGSVAHLEEHCACAVPGATCGDPEGLTRRQAAAAAVQAYLARQAQEKET